MEMLVEGFAAEAKKEIQDKHGLFLDACLWLGVDCDDDARVECYNETENTSGSISFDYLPPQIIKVYLVEANLIGTLETSSLPGILENFNLGLNQLRGTVDLCKLSETIRRFCVHRNGFTGSAALESLTEPLTYLLL